MKHILLSTLLILCSSASLLHASSGVPAELIFPAGSGPISTTAQSVAITESFILVGAPKVSYRLKAGGTEFSEAGEVLVFSTSTGKFLRRLRAAVPGYGANFGSMIAAQGNLVYVLSYFQIIQAIDINTGRTVWTANPGASDGPIPVNGSNVTCLAVDGNLLIAGQPNFWIIDDPISGFFKNTGIAWRCDALTGIPVGTIKPYSDEEAAHFGESVAVAGSIYACGSPNRNNGGLTDAGAVFVYRGSPNDGNILFAGDGVAGDHFGASVVITQGRLLVGAPEANFGGYADNGKVYVFDAVTLAYITTVNAPNSVGTFGGFGSAMSANGPLVTIGAAGSAWLYDVGSNTLQPLSPNFQGTTFRYGEAMAIYGNTALVADWSATGGSAQKGRVMRFNQLGRSWGQAIALAKTKRNAPGTAMVTTFASFGSAALSPMGKAMHLATVNGGGTTATNNAGVWSTQSGTHDLVLRENDAFGTRRVTAPIKPFFNSAGQGYFLGRYAGIGNELNLFLDDGTSVSRLAGEGGPSLINGGTETISRLHDVVSCDAASTFAAFSYSSRVGVNNVTAAKDTHIGRRTTNFGIVDEAREGFASPIAGVNYGQISPRLAVNGGRLTFVTALASQPTSTSTALIVKSINMANAVVAARKGDIAPGTSTAKFSAFVSEAVCASATVFRATLSGGPSGVTSGVWLHATSNNGVYPVALRLGQAPGCSTGIKFTRFLQTFISDAGLAVFVAQLTGPGVTSANDIGVWVRTITGQQYLVLREGEMIGGARGMRIGTLQRFDLGKTGHYTALVSLVGASTVSNQALLTGNLLHPNPLMFKPTVTVRKGSNVDHLLSLPYPVSSVKALSMGSNNLDATGSGSKGIAKLVNDNGVIFTATFAEGVELVVGRP